MTTPADTATKARDGRGPVTWQVDAVRYWNDTETGGYREQVQRFVSSLIPDGIGDSATIHQEEQAPGGHVLVCRAYVIDGAICIPARETYAATEHAHPPFLDALETP